MKYFLAINILGFSLLFGQDKNETNIFYNLDNSFLLGFSDVSESYNLKYFPTLNYDMNFSIFFKKQKVHHFISLGTQINQTKDEFMNNLFLKTPLIVGIGGGNKIEFNMGVGIYYSRLLKYSANANYLLPPAFEETKKRNLLGIRNSINILYSINEKNYLGIKIINDFDITKLYDQVRFALAPNTERIYEMKNYNLQIGVNYNYRFFR